MTTGSAWTELPCREPGIPKRTRTGRGTHDDHVPWSLEFKPLGDEALAQVNIHLSELAFASVDEPVWRVCGGNNNLARVCWERRCAHRIGCRPFLNNEYFFVRVLMQSDTLARLHFDQDERNLGVCMEVSFKLRRVPRVCQFVHIHNNV